MNAHARDAIIIVRIVTTGNSGTQVLYRYCTKWETTCLASRETVTQVNDLSTPDLSLVRDESSVRYKC